MFNLQFFMPMDPPRTTFQAKDLAIIKGRPVIFDSAELIAVKAKLRGTGSIPVPTTNFFAGEVVTWH